VSGATQKGVARGWSITGVAAEAVVVMMLLMEDGSGRRMMRVEGDRARVCWATAAEVVLPLGVLSSSSCRRNLEGSAALMRLRWRQGRCGGGMLGVADRLVNLL